MSRSAGCPDWREYLLNLCVDASLDPNAMRARLEVNGDYEGVMNDLVIELGVNRFNLDFERDFKTPDDIAGAVTLLPKLFDSSVITTNFDRVLERAYENDAKAFVEKVTGRGQAGAFFRAIPAGDCYLLKLHGNLDNPAERVLEKGEYDAAYGNDGNIHFECPLPRLLKRLFSSYSFLFLGCSLSADRTIQTFMRVAQLEGPDNLPHHYALLPCPTDSSRKSSIDQRLADAHIAPLWYPEGEHDHVEQILDLLLD
jgi:SIR2-like domain